MAKRGRLNRERVLHAALELADAAGLEAVTMQRIGKRLGVEAMSLYRHVANKEDILDGLVDLILAEIELPAHQADWKDALRGRAESARRAFGRHRWAIGLVESRTRPGEVTLRHHEWVLGVLLGAGFSTAMAGHAYNLLDSYIYGFALQEASMSFRSADEQAAAGDELLAQLPADAYPNMARVAADFLASGADYADEFDFGLDLILDGIQRAAASA